MRLGAVTCLVALLMSAGLLAVAVPALAQSTNTPPVIVMGSADVDMTNLPLDDDGKKAATDLGTAMKAGTWINELLAGTPDGAYWVTEVSSKAQPNSTAELARMALEQCEYSAPGLTPCVIYEINGKEARDATGWWPTQPIMLKREAGSTFDSDTVPFIQPYGRSAIARAYPSLPNPRVLVITTAGNATWESAKGTVADTVAAALTSCTTTFPNQNCLLYAINDTVVFSP